MTSVDQPLHSLARIEELSLPRPSCFELFNALITNINCLHSDLCLRERCQWAHVVHHQRIELILRSIQIVNTAILQRCVIFERNRRDPLTYRPLLTLIRIILFCRLNEICFGFGISECYMPSQTISSIFN